MFITLHNKGYFNLSKYILPPLLKTEKWLTKLNQLLIIIAAMCSYHTHPFSLQKGRKRKTEITALHFQSDWKAKAVPGILLRKEKYNIEDGLYYVSNFTFTYMCFWLYTVGGWYKNIITIVCVLI